MPFLISPPSANFFCSLSSLHSPGRQATSHDAASLSALSAHARDGRRQRWRHGPGLAFPGRAHRCNEAPPRPQPRWPHPARAWNMAACVLSLDCTASAPRVSFPALHRPAAISHPPRLGRDALPLSRLPPACGVRANARTPITHLLHAPSLSPAVPHPQGPRMTLWKRTMGAIRPARRRRPLGQRRCVCVLLPCYPPPVALTPRETDSG